MKRSVIHLSFSREGGAGGVARVLTDAQIATGRDAHHHFVIPHNLRAEPFSAPRHTLHAAADEYLVKAPSFDAPISLFRDRLGASLASVVAQADVLHVHNLNGVLRLLDLATVAAEKRIIWTLHDMNPFTGACHYSLGCVGFTTDCSACPAVIKPFREEVSRALRHKVSAVARLGDLRIIAPSSWLAEEALKSAVFAGRNIPVIPNPLTPAGSDRGISSGEALPPITPLSGPVRVCVVAQNLSDPVKNVGEAVAAFQKARESDPELQLTLVGRNGTEFQGPGIFHTGPLAAPEVAKVYASSDALVVSSRAENSPLVIAEAAAVGCLALVGDVGGMPALVRELGAGATYTLLTELAMLLSGLKTRSPEERQSVRERLQTQAWSLYSPSAVVAQYDRHYDDT